MSATSGEGVATASPSSLIGRRAEMGRLQRGLAAARQGHGNSCLVLGPGGMGKTRLLRWLEREALSSGFQVSWGNGLQESVAPFFVFEQVFRRRASKGGATDPGSPASSAVPAGELGAYTLFEDERPRRFRATLSALPRECALLLVTRENPGSLKERGQTLPPGTHPLWITRMEGEGRVTPGDLDTLGERTARHLKEHPGGVVAVDGIEYLTSQNSFAAVLRLLQFLRDLAQEADGHLLVAINPSAFEKREVSLLESDAEVIRPVASPEGVTPQVAGGGAESPSATLLRYLQALESAAREAPQLVVVDDLHWADPQSGTAFQFLARNLRDLPVLLVGGAREEEIPANAEEEGGSLSERLEMLSREGLLERIALRGFGEEEARSLLKEVLGGSLSPTSGEVEVRELLRRTEGNPYFLREIFVQLREEGTLEEDGNGYRFARAPHGSDALLATVPPSLRRMVLQRIGRLPAEERAFLDSAAVAGSEFDLPPVAAVRRSSLQEAQRNVESLVHRRRLLEPSIESPGSRWSFSHPLVWEVTMGELSIARRKEEALALLDWWEEHRSEEVETLARLGHASGDLDRGLPWVRRALERSLAASLPESASTYLSWMRELRRSAAHPGEEGQVESEIQAAGRLSRIGGPRHARRSLLELLTEPLSDRLRWAAREALARATDPFDTQEARRIANELEGEFQRRGSDVPARLRHDLESFQAYLWMQQGDHERAMTLLTSIVEAPKSEVSPETRGRALTHGAWCHYVLGRPDRAEAWLGEVLETAQDDDATVAQAYNLQGMMAEARGDAVGMREMAEKAADHARRAGSFTNAAIYEYNAAISLVEAGKAEEAEQVGRHLWDLGTKFDVPRVRCCGAFLIARSEGTRKNAPAAVQWAERSLQEALAMQRNDDIWECQLLVAEMKGEAGNLNEALATYDALAREGVFDHGAAAVSQLPSMVRFFERRGLEDRCRVAAEKALAAAISFKNPVVERQMRETLARLTTSSKGTGGAPEPAAKPL
ncbi:MAG: DUF835 domain-containing protein [Euryarchaeota archaeon]|nr:DUF835 domain-containing protein [Euryarchaeota archaeon]MDE1837096.1 DUF835 domain-containing protein [Euryarchaeota archaeon]MDE1879692.1 DUF835 domain-containing protein [Euryarchaeota archaeon]MDE2045218.1 DUF835 domain-containing protein [Thermoplasmata archaeon]